MWKEISKFFKQIQANFSKTDSFCEVIFADGVEGYYYSGYNITPCDKVLGFVQDGGGNPEEGSL